MQIIIVGAGLVGTSLAEYLHKLGHDVTIIERDSDRIEQVGEKFDVRIVRGSGSHPRALLEAGIENADMIIAATPLDEVNIIACMIARHYSVEHRIARIRTWDFHRDSADILPIEFGITKVIYPEESTIGAVMNFIETPFAIDAQDFLDRSVLMRSYQITESMPIANKPLSDLRSQEEGKVLLVVAIIRGEEVFIPRGDARVLPGDKLLVLFPKESLDYFLTLVGLDSKPAKKAVVYGNSLTAINIARALNEELESVVFIDPDYQHAQEASLKLQKMDVLHGDGADVDVLREANIRFADFFIAASKQNDENILSCLLAKSEGAREVIAVVNDDQHIDLFHSIGINHVINPRQLTAAGILNAIYNGFVAPSAHIQKTDIDVLRFAVSRESPIAHKALKDGWKKVLGYAIVGVVIREERMIIPDGDTVLMPGDIVIVFSRGSGIKAVTKLFGESP